MKSLSTEKRYILRKFVMAKSVKEALRKEPLMPVHEIYVDEKWEDERVKQIGFK